MPKLNFDLENSLAALGLEGKRAVVYLTLLQLGKAPVHAIAKAAKIKRTTVYSVLEILEEQGLVARIMEGKKQLFLPEDPEKMRTVLQDKQKTLEAILPDLRSVYNLLPSKPRVRYYEGIEGIKAIFEDTLHSHPKEILAYSSLDDLTALLGDYMKQYAVRKAELGIPLRGIVLDTPYARHYIPKHYKNAGPKAMPSARFVPAARFPFKNEINIYANKVAIMSLNSDELVGVIIESQVIADTQRAIFELCWEGAAKYTWQNLIFWL